VLTYRDPRDGDRFAAWLDAAKGVSGVYVFRSRGLFGGRTIEYVGESHSDRLYKTITRHFWAWDDPTHATPHYTISGWSAIELAIVVCPKSRAIAVQDALIRRLKPERNARQYLDDDVVPF
jgi:hypothetical protein